MHFAKLLHFANFAQKIAKNAFFTLFTREQFLLGWVLLLKKYQTLVLVGSFLVSSLCLTTLQSMMNAKLSLHGF